MDTSTITKSAVPLTQTMPGSDSKILPPPSVREAKPKRKYEDLEIDGFDATRPSRAEAEESMAKAQNTVRNILKVVYCNMKFDTWFRSPMYFEDYKRGGLAAKPRHPTESGSIHFKEGESVIDTMYVCDTCMKYSTEAKDMAIHMPKCEYKNELPGRVVYDSPYYQIRKVDGARHPLYAQCLSLFAKLFLDSKSIFFSVENFDYYILTISVANIRVLDSLAKNKPAKDEKSSAAKDPELMNTIESESSLSSQRVIGFFSKEKVSWDHYNLACITVFPPFQQRGLGKLLISYSYYLSKKAKQAGTPERPLSEHGFVSYLSYWSSVVSHYITDTRKKALEEGKSTFTLSIDDISAATFMIQSDVVQALQSMGALEKQQVKSPAKGKQASSSDFKYVIDYSKVENWIERNKNKTQGPILIEGYCLVRRRQKLRD